MTRDELSQLAAQALADTPSSGTTNEWLMRFADLVTERVKAEKQKVCPYVQGEVTHWCLLAEKGQPLTDDAIRFKFSTMGESFTPLELEAFRSGVRFAERSHGITG